MLHTFIWNVVAYCIAPLLGFSLVDKPFYIFHKVYYSTLPIWQGYVSAMIGKLRPSSLFMK